MHPSKVVRPWRFSTYRPRQRCRRRPALPGHRNYCTHSMLYFFNGINE